MNNLDRAKAVSIASSWRRLNDEIHMLSEEQLEYLIEREQERDSPRTTVLERLHQRLSRKRARRERKELLK
jgi:hypothetical protein